MDTPDPLDGNDTPAAPGGPATTAAPAATDTEATTGGLRPELLVEAAIVLARQEGPQAVTLSSAAARCGVPEDVARSHYPTLDDLLRAMRLRLVSRYEHACLDALREGVAAGDDEPALFRRTTEAYVCAGLEEGGLYAALGVILGAAGSTGLLAEDYLSRRHTMTIASAFHVSPEDAWTGFVLFCGAADSLVQSIRSGLVRHDVGVEVLAGLFSTARVFRQVRH